MRKIILILTALVLSLLALVVFVSADAPPVSLPATASVTVNEYISLTLLNIPIDFGIMNPGEVNKYDTGPMVVRIGNETNVVVNIYTRADDTMFRSGTNGFLIEQMQWAITSNFYSLHNYQTFDSLVTNGTAGHDYPIYHRIAIPLGQPQGVYTVNITITAIGS
jgi:hypothetical protein